MSTVAIGMNLFLSVLMIAALYMGWRLERRLRAVRDSHALFTRAVADLDGAVARAHSGLAELREATDESIDLLGGRLTRAREAADRLEKAIADAERAPVRGAGVALVERLEQSEPLRMRTPPAAAVAPTSLKGLMELAETVRPDTGIVRRGRPPADEDLFEDRELTL